jgi:hypothetical protein
MGVRTVFLAQDEIQWWVFEHANEPTDFMKGGRFLYQLTACHLLKDCAPWS